ncbi:MAG TPA: hypothetical protein VFM48_15925 [Aquabacterium sp.]|nr:hypothetical protein [Aquabacterium sp.]
MDHQRRILLLGAPAAVLLLHGCGGAEGDSGSQATAQAVDRTSAQPESASQTSTAFTVRNRSGGNFPTIGSEFQIPGNLTWVQAVVNSGSPAGIGPLLSIQVSSTRQVGSETWIAELSASIRIANAQSGTESAFDLRPGGALAGEGWLTCRQIGADGTVKTYGYRIIGGTLLANMDPDQGWTSVRLQDVVAQAAVGFNNLAQGTVAVIADSAIKLRTAAENTGSSLS